MIDPRKPKKGDRRTLASTEIEEFNGGRWVSVWAPRTLPPPKTHGLYGITVVIVGPVEREHFPKDSFVLVDVSAFGEPVGQSTLKRDERTGRLITWGFEKNWADGRLCGWVRRVRAGHRHFLEIEEAAERAELEVRGG